MRNIPSAPPSRIAVYARYSSDLQNPSSVEDQIALCRRLAREQFGVESQRLSIYSDAAITGATMQRPDVRRLLADAATGRFSLVVAEGLDRVSRTLRDIAAIYEILQYHGVGMWTAHEGHITKLHIAFKGAMNEMFLDDMGDKLRRGQSARIAAGFALASCPYGYRIKRGVVDARGRTVNGVREVHPEEAAVVRRIFREYVAGRGLTTIIRGLNADGIPGIHGRPWLRRSLSGRAILDEGILRNEIYIGRLIYNKRVTLRDPITGKKRYKLQPKESWTRVEVPHLRIVDDNLWQSVRDRMEKISRPNPSKRKLPLNMVVHNQHALTGWVRCGVCGGGKTIANASRYVCSNNRFERVCRNSRGTREPVLLDAVFAALMTRISSGPDFRPQLVRVFAQQMDRSSELRTEAASIAEQIERYLDAIGAGVEKDKAIVRILDLQAQQKDVEEELGRMMLPDLPEEPEIRSRLARAVMNLKGLGSVPDQRNAFDHLLKAVILTPIESQRNGETFTVELREEGWPGFWGTCVAT